jgi:hypothetical protein
VDPEAGIYGVLNPETGEYEDPSAVTEIRTDESEWMEYVWFKFGINGSVFARSLLRLKERGIVASEAGLVWTLDRDAHHRAWLEQFGGGLVDEARKRTPGERGRSRDPAVGCWQAAARRGRHRPTQGPLRPGAPPRQDSRRSAYPAGGDDGRLHLWTVSKRSPRATVASSGRSFGLSNCTSHVSGRPTLGRSTRPRAWPRSSSNSSQNLDSGRRSSALIGGTSSATNRLNRSARSDGMLIPLTITGRFTLKAYSLSVV